MSQIETSGPAFTRTQDAHREAEGMTIRYCLAAKAMQGVCSIPNDAGALHWTAEGIAECAHVQANVMLDAKK